MYYCEQCGRPCKKKIRYNGYTLCSKHMHQLHKYGKFLDNIQRTTNDLNDYIIQGQDVIFNLYNQRNEKVGEFVIDLEDIDKVRYKKWRVSHSHVITGLPYKMQDVNKKSRDISHVILDIDPNMDNITIIDHKDGDGFNNRKSNLRICEQSNNTLNKSFVSNNTSGFIGVSYSKKRNVWCPEIRYNYKRWHLGHWKSKEYAVYARLVAEIHLFGEFQNQQELKKKQEFTQCIPQKRKDEIKQYVINKLSV